MQKVVGSSPIIRSSKPRSGGVFVSRDGYRERPAEELTTNLGLCFLAGPKGSVRAETEGGAAMLSLRVKLALVTLASFAVAALAGGNTWSV